MVSAIALVDESLVLGYWDGSIEVIEGTGSGATTRRLPESGGHLALFLAKGPRNTLVAAWATGRVGLYHLPTGALLHSIKLHGKPVHFLEGERGLHVVTDLGDFAFLDLEVYHLDHCRLLEQVWQAVPVVWDKERATVTPPPADHRCSTRP
jgi:hypothetical protein